MSLENVQRRATKMVPALKHMSCEDRLRTLGLPTLLYRRERADMIQVFKALNEFDAPIRDPYNLSSHGFDSQSDHVRDTLCHNCHWE